MPEVMSPPDANLTPEVLAINPAFPKNLFWVEAKLVNGTFEPVDPRYKAYKPECPNSGDSSGSGGLLVLIAALGAIWSLSNRKSR